MIGRSIGNYKIVRVLGEGGMGTVYLAEHPMIGKKVAVKMLRPDLSTDPGLVSRFFQEAKAVNDIRHPNIVDISDFGHTEEGTVYLVMEFMDGRSLRDQLAASGPMPFDLMVLVARQVIDALAAAHRAGFIHRDLKPDNIFLVTDTLATGGVRAKLFDFGVAKLLGDKAGQVGHKTIDGAVVGTPFYMSPEQALCHEVGAAADIYAMGVVMFEMVTGHVPFRSEQLVVLLNAILKQAAPPPSRVRADTPPWLDRLILRCLEKDPEARPPSMEDISAQLVAGAAELVAQNPAMSATLIGRVEVTPPPVAVPAPTQIRVSANHAKTLAGTAPTGAANSSSGEMQRLAHARQGGLAGPAARPTALDHLKRWLEQKNVRRILAMVGIAAVLLVVGSIFLKTSPRPPALPPVVEQPAPALPATPEGPATIRLLSTPPGAEVTRLSDNRILGTTPLIDTRRPDGHTVDYRFHLHGHTDVQMPFQANSPGEFELSATLHPVEKRDYSGSRSGREGKTHKTKSSPSSATAPAPAAVAAPSPPQKTTAPTEPGYQVLPPLGDRNPVKRLRH